MKVADRPVEFRVVDFSPVLYKAQMPPVRQGKFLQLVEGGKIETLVLSPYGLSKFHAQILERYCLLNDLDGRFLRKPEYYAALGADIEVFGGGHWKIDDLALRLELYGESTAYGRFDPDGLAEKIGGLPTYRSYRIVVR